MIINKESMLAVLRELVARRDWRVIRNCLRRFQLQRILRHHAALHDGNLGERFPERLFRDRGSFIPDLLGHGEERRGAVVLDGWQVGLR